MSWMFSSASAFNGDLSAWDVSSVTDMSYMFRAASAFNGDLSAWDVSSVVSMGSMFSRASAFNGDLSAWDVSAVTDMWFMFSQASTFNGDLGAWDVSSVTNMRSMFYNASVFNGDTSAWDVSAVTNMSSMFAGASAFNGDISAWDVAAVTDISSMFGGASTFNGDISAWDVSSVTNMRSMFSQNSAFNGDLSAWDVSSVTIMFRMFSQASAFDGDLSAWDVSAVTDMGSMFYRANAFNGDLSTWDVSAVTNMGSMFNRASAFNGDLSAWDVSAVTDMSSIFSQASAFNGDLSAWDVSSVTDMRFMFSEASAFNGDLSAWDVSSVTYMMDMFEEVTLSTPNYDALLNSWSGLSLQSGVVFNGGNSTYSSASQAARDVLTDTFGWTVSDGGLVATYTIGGTVSGLLGSGLLLQNNEADDLNIDIDGAFTFATPLADLSAYAVTVAAQPNNPPQYCVVATGSGELSGADISDISITCTAPRLNDTGLTWGGNYPTGNNATCTGESVAQQDCSHGRDVSANDDSDGHAGFSFTKLDANGSPLPASALEWSCVQDNVTGLVWEVKTTDGGIHDRNNTYRWGGTGADPYGTTFYDDWDTLVDGSNTEVLCGYSDWRVPRKKELIGIVSYDRNNPAIDSNYFPNTPPSYFWSASANARSSGSAWFVGFDYGYASFGSRSGSRHVRLVRGGQ